MDTDMAVVVFHSDLSGSSKNINLGFNLAGVLKQQALLCDWSWIAKLVSESHSCNIVIVVVGSWRKMTLSYSYNSGWLKKQHWRFDTIATLGPGFTIKESTVSPSGQTEPEDGLPAGWQLLLNFPQILLAGMAHTDWLTEFKRALWVADSWISARSLGDLHQRCHNQETKSCRCSGKHIVMIISLWSGILDPGFFSSVLDGLLWLPSGKGLPEKTVGKAE